MESGLDFRRTTPPVAEIVDLAIGVFRRYKLLFAIQAYESVIPDSLAELTARFQSSALKVYDINAQAKNPGLLLGSVGWSTGWCAHLNGERSWRAHKAVGGRRDPAVLHMP